VLLSRASTFKGSKQLTYSHKADFSFYDSQQHSVFETAQIWKFEKYNAERGINECFRSTNYYHIKHIKTIGKSFLFYKKESL